MQHLGMLAHYSSQLRHAPGRAAALVFGFSAYAVCETPYRLRAVLARASRGAQQMAEAG